MSRPRAVENADNAQPHGDRRKLRRRVREQWRETQQTVSGGFSRYRRSTEPAVGARECASGGQPCSGTTGISPRGDEEAQHQRIFPHRGTSACSAALHSWSTHAGRVVVHKDQRQDGNQHPEPRTGINEELGCRRIITRFPVEKLLCPTALSGSTSAPASFPRRKKNRNMSMAGEHADNAA